MSFGLWKYPDMPTAAKLWAKRYFELEPHVEDCLCGKCPPINEETRKALEEHWANRPKQFFDVFKREPFENTEKMPAPPEDWPNFLKELSGRVWKKDHTNLPEIAKGWKYKNFRGKLAEDFWELKFLNKQEVCKEIDHLSRKAGMA